MEKEVQAEQADRCAHCGNWHSGQCPRIKMIEYYPDGTVKRVVYHPNPWPWAYHRDEPFLRRAE